MELYEVNDEFVKNLAEQTEQGINNAEDFIDSFEQFKLSEEEFLNKNKNISYVIANKKAELEVIKNHKKDILAKEKSLNNTIEYLSNLQGRNIINYYDGNIKLAKKKTKGFLNFRKSEVVNTPNNIDEIISNDFTIEGINQETGEIEDMTDTLSKTSVILKKLDIKDILKNNGEVIIRDKDGNEYTINLEEKINISTPKVIR